MEINKVARPSRSRNPPVIYTPSSIYQGKPQQMSYNLNARKALDKKMDAAERESEIEITLKAGTLVSDANGYMLQDFISKDLHNIFDDFKADKSVKNINMQIKNICKTAKEHLDKAATKHKTDASKAIVDEIHQSNKAHTNELSRIAIVLNHEEKTVDKETNKSADTTVHITTARKINPNQYNLLKNGSNHNDNTLREMAIDEISTCSREGEELTD
ncbi:unnamed protein product [Mytilus coruscus]|uniref:Uncharacterized protein n=1 Tax=Mytilus coruscus TaxID=42192 RepID=A0A6J8BY08_MYTCO|nr:unnamed protein product [Mytilus coruscus]